MSINMQCRYVQLINVRMCVFECVCVYEVHTHTFIFIVYYYIYLYVFFDINVFIVVLYCKHQETLVVQ